MRQIVLLLSVFWGAPHRGGRRLGFVLHHWSWGFLNAAAGLGAASFCVLVLRAHVYRWRELLIVHYPGRRTQAATLGPYVLGSGSLSEELLQHERGHWLQSLALGPVYYGVIGIPSLLHAAWFSVFRSGSPREHYFRFYTEGWADAWGGVWRMHGHAVLHWREYLKPKCFRRSAQ